MFVFLQRITVYEKRKEIAFCKTEHIIELKVADNIF
jgi:hypothetical protein